MGQTHPGEHPGEPSKSSEQLTRRVENGLERGRPIAIVVDGLPVPAFEGESVAAALLAAGTRVLKTTARYGAPRGLYGGMGVCFECVMTIEGRPNVRSCQTPEISRPLSPFQCERSGAILGLRVIESP